MADVGTVTVVRDSGVTQVAAALPHRMELRTESGKVVLALDLAPREIEYGGLAMDWATAERTGDRPLLMHKSIPLKTLGFSFTMTDKRDLYAAQTVKAATVTTLGRTFERIMVRYSGHEQGLWRITDLKLSSVLRSPETNEITRATVSITLTEASDPAPAVGPVSKPPPPPPAPPPVQRIHVVVRGDTLWGIAKRFYGNGALWPRLYDANRNQIRDPHWIYPGQRFVVP